MTSPSTPRFIARTDSGEEIAIESVEVLQERVEAGDVPPEAELFDAGTGVWAPAIEVPVYRFLLEELQAEGTLPEGYEAALQGYGETDGPSNVTEPAASAGDPDPTSDDQHDDGERRAAAAGDPGDLDFELDLVDFEFNVPAPPAREPVKPPSPPEKKRPSAPERDRGDAAAEGSDSEPDAPDKEPADDESWMMPASEGGLALPASEPRAAKASQGEAPPDEEDAPALWQPESEDPRELSSSTLRRRRSPLGLPVALGGGVVLLVVVLGLAIFVGRDGADVEPVPFGVSQLSEAPTPPEPPPGLEEAVEVVLEDIARAFAAVADSVRVDRGLAPSPPREWLTGFYLANASRFPGVSDFWDEYRSFLMVMGPLDRSVYLEGVSEGMESAGPLSPAERDALESYFLERYEVLSGHRSERYGHLAETARAAVALHQLLERHEAEITYSPALGAGVSADPILEAVIPEGPIRREVDAALDRIFRALDQSRGGGAPSADGLRTELFMVFGRG
jgi:hypothetical protein